MRLDWKMWPAARRRMALALVVLLGCAIAVLTAASEAPVSTAPATGGDAATYAAIIERMRGGEGYYPAAHAVLLADGYGTLSVFNWRTPAWPMLVAALPPGGAQLVLVLAALAALGLAFAVVRERSGPLAGLVVQVLVGGSLAGVAAPEAVLFTEVAAGLLILLSIEAQAGNRPHLAIVAGLMALFVRELAAPYVLVAMGLALWRRDWRQAAAWGAGLLLYAGYFGWHGVMVTQRLGPADRAYPEGWVQFGGLGFILATVGFNGVWSLAPDWIRPVLLLTGLLGLAVGRAGPLALGTVLAYLVAFSIVGKVFNAYWGALYTPLLMLGVGLALAGLLPTGAGRGGAEGLP